MIILHVVQIFPVLKHIHTKCFTHDALLQVLQGLLSPDKAETPAAEPTPAEPTPAAEPVVKRTVPWTNDGIPKYRATWIGKRWEKMGICRKIWENHGNIWETYGKHRRNTWETYGKYGKTNYLAFAKGFLMIPQNRKSTVWESKGDRLLLSWVGQIKVMGLPKCGKPWGDSMLVLVDSNWFSSYIHHSWIN